MGSDNVQFAQDSLCAFRRENLFRLRCGSGALRTEGSEVNELYLALIAFRPALAASYTRAELEEQITSLIDRLIYAALMAPRGGAPE